MTIRRSAGWSTSFRPRPSSQELDVSSTVRRQCVSTVTRSEEHTSELQSQSNLVCRLLLEKKKHLARGSPAAADAQHPSVLPTRRLPTPAPAVSAQSPLCHPARSACTTRSRRFSVQPLGRP